MLRFNRIRLKELREARGMTQHELGAALRVTEHAVYAWEYGRRAPSLQTIDKIAHLLGVPFMDMLTGAQEEVDPE